MSFLRTSFINYLKLICLLLSVFSFSACGQKGKLSLPSIPPPPSESLSQGPAVETAAEKTPQITESEDDEDEEKASESN